MIAKLREARGWNCKQLAEELDEPPVTVHRLETKWNGYNPKLINKLCEVFKVSPNLLFTINEKEEKVLKALQEHTS